MKTTSVRFFSTRRIVVLCLSSVVCISAVSVWAGDLTTDNLAVTKDAVVMGNVFFPSGGVATGGIITTNNGYLIHAFLSNGTFSVTSGSLNCSVLVVGGGGGAGGGEVGVVYHAGGGGGEVKEIAATNVSGNVQVNIGVGGDTGDAGGAGGASSFGTTSASGGGGGQHPGTAGASGNGHSGGVRNSYAAGGGGGNSANGANAAPGNIGGNGGNGTVSSISGSNVYYGGGGAGGGVTYGTNGLGGGMGSYGGGGKSSDAKGGSGIVIVRYSMNALGAVTKLSIFSNGINQSSASGTNTFMGKVGVGTNNPAEKLHVVGNMRVDGTNIFSAIQLGNEAPRTNWPNVLIASSNLFDVPDKAAARTNLGLGSAATNGANAFLAPAGNGSQLTGITASQVGALAPDGNGSQLTGITASQVGALTPSGDGSQLTGITAAQVGALTPNGDGSQLTNITAGQVGALSATGGVVSGNVHLNGSLFFPPADDIPMGAYTNQQN